jgi:hypothetical protein
MGRSRKPLILWGAGGALLLSALIGLGVFLLRPPVVLVTDLSFERLYGRSRGSRLETSLALFRRVKTAVIAENAGSDLIAFAAAEAAENPYGVLFPYRYVHGAERYSRRFPSTPVAVFGGRRRDDSPEIPGVLWTDTLTDFYRAGLCAAVLSREGEVLFFEDPSVSAADRAAFAAGLKEGGYGGGLRYVPAGSDLFPREGLACAVISGPASDFFELDLKIPVILFSWADPAITSREVLVIFDDSPWALAAEGVRSLSRGGVSGSPASKVLILRRRIRERGILRELRRRVVVHYPEKG